MEHQGSADAFAELEIASALDRKSREEEAIPHYQKALDLGLSGDAKADAFIGLGSSLRLVGRLEDAVQVLDRAAHDFPQRIDIGCFVMIARISAGVEVESSKDVLRRLLDSGPIDEYDEPIRRYALEVL